MNYSLEYLCFTPESQYLERKSARKKPRELLKTLIGFANADGGILVIGVEDDGRITGFNHSKAHSIESFQQIDRELVSTPIVKRFDIISVTNEAGESDKILIICVDPSVNRVIVAPNDVVYLRQGDETIELSYERRRMLEYDRGQCSWICSTKGPTSPTKVTCSASVTFSSTSAKDRCASCMTGLAFS